MSDDTLSNIRRARQHIKQEKAFPASNGMEEAMSNLDKQETRFLADAQLGKRVREMLASEEPPEGLARSLATFGAGRLAEHDKESALRAWAWFREQLLGNQCCCGHRGCGGACCSECSPGSLATGGINPAEEAEQGCGYVKPMVRTQGMGLGAAPVQQKPWRLARSLSTLRGQLATLYPQRSRASDGTIGDARHASNKSDHNPHVPDPEIKEQGVVTAIDITHDPASGCDCGLLAGKLYGEAWDERIKYVIFDRHIWNPSVSLHWRPYGGSNPHTKHLHLSVKSDPKLFDSTEPWRI